MLLTQRTVEVNSDESQVYVVLLDVAGSVCPESRIVWKKPLGENAIKKLLPCLIRRQSC